jgi:hypothetical protein
MRSACPRRVVLAGIVPAASACIGASEVARALEKDAGILQNRRTIVRIADVRHPRPRSSHRPRGMFEPATRPGHETQNPSYTWSQNRVCRDVILSS